jgi:hypothetical protein
MLVNTNNNRCKLAISLQFRELRLNDYGYTLSKKSGYPPIGKVAEKSHSWTRQGVEHMSQREPLVVHATWDDEAQVWVATSEDVPGLATEAPNWDKLVQKLQVMIPELLDANGYPDGDDEVRFKLLGEVNAVAYREAA